MTRVPGCQVGESFWVQGYDTPFWGCSFVARLAGLIFPVCDLRFFHGQIAAKKEYQEKRLTGAGA